MDQENKGCIHCGSMDVKSRGHNSTGKNEYQCMSCGRYFCYNARINTQICIDCGATFVGIYRKRCDPCNEIHKKKRYDEYKEAMQLERSLNPPKERKIPHNYKKNRPDVPCPHCNGIATTIHSSKDNRYHCKDCDLFFVTKPSKKMELRAELKAEKERLKEEKAREKAEKARLKAEKQGFYGVSIRKMRITGDRMKLDTDTTPRFCMVCNTEKPGNEMYVRNTKYPYDICKDCYKEQGYQFKRYGVTNQQMADMLSKQGQKCAICKTSLEGKMVKCVDHSHSTGDFRGVLCTHCNMMLGYAKDKIEVLYSAINYIIKSEPDTFDE